ncbi:MAG: cell division ATP-binding protein FtsE [Candidatus Liptonbacteria bacterium GWC1_60_9]|uniref:Cell division ATP-binding protein FtsE n=3 Tax=Candidatus Liptoniibacteriota TaxID=1817909 RepID=A0A1G2CKW9_9BACT|nr:MAG: cell division ATP-binding protein FtsE [Candidatus Liptonbacteria bacterium GWC1_60_9]OGY98473.1 MAG: cell division ATP-binding protein FtsE [Candidatus Liptonbacteria bacterium RIFCSPHIGHO2_12_FULL_60_13]OGZ02044.1 MAG: cell division ATP-binding protein FtsE [Candidatus Liptonbacteria bacterium RIFCSPLOWO2_12_FULL_60_15]
MIVFQNVSKLYGNGRSTALEDVTFKIEPNEFVSLVGRSGAGKSTVIKLLIGEERPSRGRIVFGSYEVNKLKANELPQLRRHIGVVFQDFRLLPNKNAYENVAFALEVAGRVQREIVELVPQVLDMVGLSDRMNNFPHELSGGEKQRVAIARAMIHRPEVIVADEPTGNLDPTNTAEIIKLLLKINELGTTIILATHDKEIINHLERRVITLDGGRVIRDEKKGKYILI